MRNGNGTVYKTLTFENPEGNDVDFEVKVNWWNDPGVRTYSNGDPGYPPDSGYEIGDMKPEQPAWLTDEMIEEELDMVMGEPEDEPDDFDYDPEEEPGWIISHQVTRTFYKKLMKAIYEHYQQLYKLYKQKQ